MGKVFLLALVLGVFSANTLVAQQTEAFPRLVKIINVPATETLNVRQAATVVSQNIGDLGNGDQVELLEQVGGWSRILWQEGNGWIATRFTQPIERPQLASGLPTGLQCGGTEPQWSVKLLKLGVAYYNDGSYLIQKSGISRNNGTDAYYFSGEGLNGVLRRAACNDGMSDRIYGWRIDLIDGQGMFSGCCFLR